MVDMKFEYLKANPNSYIFKFLSSRYEHQQVMQTLRWEANTTINQSSLPRSMFHDSCVKLFTSCNITSLERHNTCAKTSCCSG